MQLCVLFIALIPFTTPFNLCHVSSTVCLPMSDLQANCSCILVSDGLFEVTNETNLFMSGMRIPLELFSQHEIPLKQRQIVDSRLGNLLPQDASLYLSPPLFTDMHIDEHFTLFTCNRSVLVDVLKALSTSEAVDAVAELVDWCGAGDCNIFTNYPSTFNRTINVYTTQVLLAEAVTDEEGISLVVISVVRGQFSVPRLLSTVCTRECRRQFWANGEYCRMKCAQNIRHNRITLIGSQKHDWLNLLRIAAVDNVRKKYAAFIEPHYGTLPNANLPNPHSDLT